MHYKTSPFLRLSIFSLLIASFSIFISSCNKKSDTPERAGSGLMVVNLAADRNAIGFYVDGGSITYSPLAFTNYNGGYQPIYAGSRTVSAFDFNIGSTLASADQNFEEGKYYSAFLMGNNNGYETVVAHDNLDSLQALGTQTYVRFVNAVADSSVATSVRTTQMENQPVEMPVPFKTVSGFEAAHSGDISVELLRNGSIATQRTLNLEPNKVYTVLLAGIPGNSGSDSLQIKYITNGTVTP